MVARLRTLSAVEGEQLGVSAGVATYPSACADRNDLYRAADEALYRSKRERRGVVHAYRRGGNGPPLEPAATA